MLSDETIKKVLKELEIVPAELSLCVINNEILANAGNVTLFSPLMKITVEI